MPVPITRDCDPLVEQVVMATDDFCYGTSAFTFWAQFSLGNFQLKHLPYSETALSVSKGAHTAQGVPSHQHRPAAGLRSHHHCASTVKAALAPTDCATHPIAWALWGGPRQGGTT